MVKTLLFSSDVDEMYPDFESIKADYMLDCDLDADAVGLDDEVYTHMCDLLGDDFDSFMNEVPEDGEYLVKYSCGRWDGNCEGVRFLDNLHFVFQYIIRDEDDFEFYFEDDVLKVITSNHDASSYYEIYKITDRGRAYWGRHVEDSCYKDGKKGDLCSLILSIPAYVSNVPDWR